MTYLAYILMLQLKHGASVDHRNVLGENVWKFAITSNDDLILKLLVVHQMSLAVDKETGELHCHNSSIGLVSKNRM